MEYGSDEEYMDMAIASMKTWREWNQLLGEKIYHEVGFIVACTTPINSSNQSFAHASYHNLIKRGYSPERLNNNYLKK